MASQVFSGNGNFSYTNSTGQNVRVIINFMQSTNLGVNAGGISMSWTGASVSAPYVHSLGRNLAFYNGIINDVNNIGYNSQSAGNMVCVDGSTAQRANIALPTEIMLAPNQGFSAVCGPYNIVVVKEDGS